MKLTKKQIDNLFVKFIGDSVLVSHDGADYAYLTEPGSLSLSMHYVTSIDAERYEFDTLEGFAWTFSVPVEKVREAL